MRKNRITCMLMVVLFVLATILSSCQSAPSEPKDSAQITGSDTAENTSDGTQGSSGTDDTSGSDSNVTPPDGGIIPPDVEGTVSTPLMWHVTSENGGELYLLGSIHVGLDDTCLFSDAVYDAFDACDAIAVESDVIAIENDMAASVQMLRQMVYTDGSSIRAHVDDASYEAAKALMEEAGYYNRFMDYYCPVVWEQMIDQILIERTSYKMENGVDRYFLSEAKRLGKDVLEVEDYMQTYAALAALSDKTQAYLLRQSVDEETVSSYSEAIAHLYDLWKAGNLGDVEEAISGDTTGYTPEELECAEEYDRTLVANRNTIMVSKADEYLRDGKHVFYVVGLAHMVGDGGIVKSLAEMGYNVQQMN